MLRERTVIAGFDVVELAARAATGSTAATASVLLVRAPRRVPESA